MATHTATVPPVTAPSPEATSAADNIFRQFCRYLGVAYILSFIGLSGAILSSADVVPMWWTVAAALSIYGSAFVMFAVSFRRPDVTWVRWAATAVAIGYGLTVATWPLVWNGELIDSSHGMWFTQFNGFVAATAGLAWRVRWSLPYLVYVVVSVQFVNQAVRTPQYETAVLTEIAWSFCLSVMPYAIAVAAVRSGRVLDATRVQSAAAAAEAAATVARASEQSRFDALTHDGVMSALLAAARHPMSDALVAQAAGTLAKLDMLEAGARHQADYDPAAAISEFRGAAGEVDDTIRVAGVVAVGAELTRYPHDVVQTMSAAAVEALRNSVRHAGSDARRSVEVTANRDVLLVVVDDDGAGFDPRSVPAGRLGLAVSIRGRMDQLPGGGAVVISSPGKGTSVRLRWTAP